MKQTWRWFGPNDLVSIDDMLQAGVEGVVSALHHIQTGAVWQPDQIAQRQNEIGQMSDGAPSGLAWDVVESLPVSEDIKKQSGNWKEHIVSYKESLRNLQGAGIETVCYNFMPILDWTRTDLSYRLPNGATCMRFDLIDFATFDIYVLARPGAAEDFPENVVDAAAKRFADMTDEARTALGRNIVSGLPGAAEAFSLDDVRAHLTQYDQISPEQLRTHLVDFLSEIMPTVQELGMRMCCHPDDPPFSLLGLPRIMSTEDDYQKIMDAVNVVENGVTLCSGSLGARPDNDLAGMMERMGDRVHFLHLRNVERESDQIMGSFHEAEHLGGGTDMVALLAAILRQEKTRKTQGRKDASIPMRPDHGQDILDDHTRKTQPGYPSIGRLKGLAELRGITSTLSHPVEGLQA